jgi:hypothetical protein
LGAFVFVGGLCFRWGGRGNKRPEDSCGGAQVDEAKSWHGKKWHAIQHRKNYDVSEHVQESYQVPPSRTVRSHCCQRFTFLPKPQTTRRIDNIGNVGIIMGCSFSSSPTAKVPGVVGPRCQARGGCRRSRQSSTIEDSKDSIDMLKLRRSSSSRGDPPRASYFRASLPHPLLSVERAAAGKAAEAGTAADEAAAVTGTNTTTNKIETTPTKEQPQQTLQRRVMYSNQDDDKNEMTTTFDSRTVSSGSSSTF